ncbi:replication endonuclease [Hylemonella gracilis]|uniref:replication endonuclease n=1 Tax=Hylemonella gracilis TaxID=80880 RepID=UPI0013F16558|nr:replication endonuclease [Hylemonella gracilis]
MYRLSDHDWARLRVSTLPIRWATRLLTQWENRRTRPGDGDWHELEAGRAANLELLRLTNRLKPVRIHLDASDSEICARADDMAAHCAQLAQVYHQAEPLRAAMTRHCLRQGIEAPDEDKTDHGAMARMTDPLWWRLQLRQQQGRAVEGAAITLGYVNKRRDIYVSNETLQRRQQQNKRNAETLEATKARNELGQEFTLAELAAGSTSNKRIKRAELMTRIGGFERVATSLSHAGIFLTITCPSRMHRHRTLGGRVEENSRYDGTDPSQAQAYLGTVWARIRASLKRQGISLYGFRIAEPQHDGTPHWHFLLFCETDQIEPVESTVRRYALADSPDEPGAHRHRVDCKRIDPDKGTAAGYIAKYVAKNIDGHGLSQDYAGGEYLEAEGKDTAQRVEAWATTWGIRQFQQIGGPPVTVWRELRRVDHIPEGAPEHLRQAHRAVNKTTVFEGRDTASVSWAHYCEAQGGVTIGRKYRIRISTEDRGAVGRYGEGLGAQPIGIETDAIEHYTPPHMAHMTPLPRIPRRVHWFVASVRHAWEIISRSDAERQMKKRAIGAPWTCVNNCTSETKSEGERPASKRTSAPDKLFKTCTHPARV